MLKNQLKIIQVIFAVVASLLIISCTSMYKQESTGQFIDSSVITTKVKSKLIADDSIKSLPINVKTYKNTVQLSGFVDTYKQKHHAAALARSVEGVQEVENALIVKSR